MIGQDTRFFIYIGWFLYLNNMIKLFSRIRVLNKLPSLVPRTSSNNYVMSDSVLVGRVASFPMKRDEILHSKTTLTLIPNKRPPLLKFRQFSTPGIFIFSPLRLLDLHALCIFLHFLVPRNTPLRWCSTGQNWVLILRFSPPITSISKHGLYPVPLLHSFQY